MSSAGRRLYFMLVFSVLNIGLGCSSAHGIRFESPSAIHTFNLATELHVLLLLLLLLLLVLVLVRAVCATPPSSTDPWVTRALQHHPPRVVVGAMGWTRVKEGRVRSEASSPHAADVACSEGCAVARIISRRPTGIPAGP
ncbi:hypothetical protein Vafri_12771 [Volvox africanus]|uniref:Uncharacterized protein n=1 Tax=Volvox africanus TaxID=51714 RepID=A0A8J4BBT4_9CHLO|nr:hypothetical protein Vafri_12771 [Volvox africanus]